MDQILTILINNGIGAGCAAAVLWLSWYRETRTIPAMIRAFGEAHRSANESWESSVRTINNGFTERNQKSLDTFSTMVREEREVYQRWHEENRERIHSLAEEVKENRHLIRNLTHEAKLRNELALQKVQPSTPRTEDQHE